MSLFATQRNKRKWRLLYSLSDGDMHDLILLCADLSRGTNVPTDILIVNALEGRFSSAMRK